jgi:3'-phosphoadenosine 5'-phosphosulfate sulfotransferase (PAPS reductase)/FAD synthetase
MQIAYTPEVQDLLSQQAPVVVGVSGGKDSFAVAIALAAELRSYGGPKVLIHSDLGSVEWLDSWPACERLAEAIGWELVKTQRPAGGMMERWESRWAANVRRYQELSCVKLILPWSTPSMRFCTSELKTDPITAWIKRRFGRHTPVVSVTGVRGEESSQRAKQPVCSGGGAKLPPGSVSWRPIHSWRLQDVWDTIQSSGIEAHEAYGKFGNTRVSCRWCIMSSEADLVASLRDPAGHEIFRRMCELELTSAFGFQAKWLTSLAPHLVENGGARLFTAMQTFDRRRAAESWLPKHLEFTKGWPHVMPTVAEAEQMAVMRSEISRLYGWGEEMRCVTADTIRARYKHLLDTKPA